MSYMIRKVPVVAVFAVLMVFFCVAVPAFAQEEDESARKLIDSEFLKKRQPAKAGTPVRKPVAYKRTSPKPTQPAAAAAAPGEVVGITIWKLRRAQAADTQESRILLEATDGGEAGEFTLERVESEMPFAAGDRVKLGIESPRDGYLYVIDREVYTDGTMSDPYLIFPTTRNRNGNNAVSAGRLIELPGASPFRLSPMQKNYAGEMLTLLVTPKPIEEITIGPRLQKLDRAMVERWEKEWAAVADRFELIGGAGQTLSRAEKEAATEDARVLTQSDDLPQTLYRVNAKAGAPLLVKVPLKIGK